MSNPSEGTFFVPDLMANASSAPAHNATPHPLEWVHRPGTLNLLGTLSHYFGHSRRVMAAVCESAAPASLPVQTQTQFAPSAEEQELLGTFVGEISDSDAFKPYTLEEAIRLATTMENVANQSAFGQGDVASLSQGQLPPSDPHNPPPTTSQEEPALFDENLAAHPAVEESVSTTPPGCTYMDGQYSSPSQETVNDADYAANSPTGESPMRPVSHPSSDTLPDNESAHTSSCEGSSADHPASDKGMPRAAEQDYGTPPDLTHSQPTEAANASPSHQPLEVFWRQSRKIPINDPPVPDFVPKMSKLLNPDASTDTNTIFIDSNDANEYDRECITDDFSVPYTDAQQKAVVKALFNAIKSTEYATDNPGMIKPFREGKWSDRRIEGLCWHIMHTCAVRHTSGPLLKAFELKPKSASELPTYADRMARIIEVLTTQKTICKHLLDPYYLFQFVDDPVASQKRVVANKNLNKRKGDIMNAGKRVMGRSSPVGSPESRPEDSFVDETPSSNGFIYGLASSSNLGGGHDPDRTLTPDGTFHGTRHFPSSVTSSPTAERALRNIGADQNMGQVDYFGYPVPAGVSLPTCSQQSSPSTASGVSRASGASVGHAKRFHNRRVPSISFDRVDSKNVTPTHSRNNSFDTTFINSPLARVVFQNQNRTAMNQSSVVRPSSDSASTSASRKRPVAEVEEAEQLSTPAKKAH